uniref:Uncharacterized protein n=1 Tax=Ditylum brightwellii TaxID=49249 RepID=A0A6U3TF74_9STRA
MAQPPPETRTLPNPPTDGITSLSYIPPGQSSSHLASTSWDGSLRIHDTSSLTHVMSQNLEAGPLLSLATPAGGSVWTGGLDGSVRKFDVSTSTSKIIGVHSGGEQSSDTEPKIACSCLSSMDGIVGSGDGTIVASAGWDGKFYLWDSRRSPGSPAATVKLPGKAFSMDSVDGKRVVIATSGRRTCIIDVRMPADEDASAKIVLDRESSLKYQTRTVRFFPDGKGLAMGSIEGRVAIEFLDEIGVESGKKKYAFKCHRAGDTVYPVNAIAFHPQLGTFATGGCDGTVVTWDGLNKKKLTTLPKFATSIAALAFNHNGTELAIASSYTFEEGEREHPRDEIFVREILDHECKPKSSK